jgi:DNA repair exonuclease SbcCD nuclease subunit
MTRFLHTADWQLGKPFSWVSDSGKRTVLQQARFDAVRALGPLAESAGARFVVVSGDLFDSPSPDRSTVSAACQAIGSIGVPVYAIPGNHDHAGPGSVWEQAYYRQEQQALAANLTILTSAAPLELPDAILLPCPLLRRQSQDDPTAWLRQLDSQSFPTGKPRIVLAHGSVQDFADEGGDDDDLRSASPNVVELNRLPAGLADYVALGDWHGLQQVAPAAWYPGAIEQDRHARSDEYVAGRVLRVAVERGQAPHVEVHETGRHRWHRRKQRLDGASGLAMLRAELDALLGGRVNQDVLRLTLTGTVGLADREQLDQLLETYEARLLRLDVDDGLLLEPGEAEIADLTSRGQDPVIGMVAQRLAAARSSGGGNAAVATQALRELFQIVRASGGDR